MSLVVSNNIMYAMFLYLYYLLYSSIISSYIHIHNKRYSIEWPKLDDIGTPPVGYEVLDGFPGVFISTRVSFYILYTINIYITLLYTILISSMN